MARQSSKAEIAGHLERYGVSREYDRDLSVLGTKTYATELFFTQLNWQETQSSHSHRDSFSLTDSHPHKRTAVLFNLTYNTSIFGAVIADYHCSGGPGLPWALWVVYPGDAVFLSTRQRALAATCTPSALRKRCAVSCVHRENVFFAAPPLVVTQNFGSL